MGARGQIFAPNYICKLCPHTPNKIEGTENTICISNSALDCPLAPHLLYTTY